MNALPPRLKEELENYTWGYIEQYKGLTPQELVEEITVDGKARRNKNPWESCDLADELPDCSYEPVSIYNPVDTSKQSIDAITPGSFDPSKNAFICSLCSVIVSRREFAKHFEQRHSSTSTQGEIRRPNAILPYDALKWYEKRELKPKARSKSKRRIEDQIRLNKKKPKSTLIAASTTRAIRQSGNSTTKLLNNVVKAAAVVSQRQRAKRHLTNCRVDSALDILQTSPHHLLSTDERVPPLIVVDKFNNDLELDDTMIVEKFTSRKRRRDSAPNSPPSHEDVLADVIPPDIAYHSSSQSSALWPAFDAAGSDSVPQPASSSSPDIEVEMEPEPMDMETESAVASIMMQHSADSRDHQSLPIGSTRGELRNAPSNKHRSIANNLPSSNSSRVPSAQGDSCKSESSNVPFDLPSHAYENGYLQSISNKTHPPSDKLLKNCKDKDPPKFNNLLLKQLITNSRPEATKHSPLSPLNPCVTPRPALPLAVCSMSCMLSKRLFTAPSSNPTARFKPIVMPRNSLWRSKRRSSCNGPSTLAKFRGTSSIKNKPSTKILYQDRSPMFIHKSGDIQATPIVLDTVSNAVHPVPSREKSINGKKRNVRQTVMRQNPAAGGMRLMSNNQKLPSTALYTNETSAGTNPPELPLRETQPPNRPLILIGAKNKAQTPTLASQDTPQLHSSNLHQSGSSNTPNLPNSNQSGVLPSTNSSLTGRMGNSSSRMNNYQLSRSSTVPQSNIPLNNSKSAAIQPGLTRNSSMGPVISIVTSDPTLSDGSMVQSRPNSNMIFSGSGTVVTSLENHQNPSGINIVQSQTATSHPFLQKTRLTASELHQLRNGGGLVLPNRGFAVSQQTQCLSQSNPSFSQASQYANGSNLTGGGGGGGTVIFASNATSLNTNTAPVHQRASLESSAAMQQQHSYQSHQGVTSVHSGSSNSATMMGHSSQYLAHQNQVMHNLGVSSSQQNEANSGASSGDQMMHLHQLQRQYYSQPGTPLPQHSSISLGGNAGPQPKLQPGQQILHTASHGVTYKQPPVVTQQRRSVQMQRGQSNPNFSGQHIISGNQARGRVGGRLAPANHIVDVDSSSQAPEGPQVVHIAAPVKQQIRSVNMQHHPMQQPQSSTRMVAPSNQQQQQQQQQMWTTQPQHQTGLSQGHTLVTGPGSQQLISQQQNGPISQKLRSQVLNRMARSRHGDSHSEQILENIEMLCTTGAISNDQITSVSASSHVIQCLPAPAASRAGGPLTTSNTAPHQQQHQQSAHPGNVDKVPLFIRQSAVNQAAGLPSSVVHSNKGKQNHDFCLNTMPPAKCQVPIHPQSSTALVATNQPEFMPRLSPNQNNVPLYMPLVNSDTVSTTIAFDQNLHSNSSILPS